MSHGYVVTTVIFAAFLCAIAPGEEDNPLGRPSHASKGMKRDLLAVSTFGATGDTTTDDGPAIRRAIHAAITSGKPATVQFEPTTYRINDRDDRWESFDLINATSLTIDGNGATLIFSPNSRAFVLDGCDNCTIQNFTIDYDPLPFTQGDIIEVDAPNEAILLKLHDGYPDPPTQEWMIANYGTHGGWRHAPVLDAETRTFTPRMHVWGGNLLPKTVEPVDKAARTYRITVSNPDVLQHVHSGHRLALRVRYADKARNDRLDGLPVANIQIRRSSNCVLRNIRQYCSPNISVHLWANTGRITLDGYRVICKPGSDRLVTSLSDGVHCKANRIGPLIENCEFEGLMDDSINISTMAELVEEVVSDTVLRTRCSEIAWYVDPIEIGDEFEAVDMKAGRILGRAKVVNVTNRHGHLRSIHFDRPVEGIFARKDPRDMQCCWLFNLSACGNDYIIRNNRFGPQMRSAMLLRASGLVESNVIDQVGGLGVYVANGLHFSEGPIPQHITIRGNTINNCKHHPGIAIGSASFNPGMAPLGHDFLIENNTIQMITDFPAIQLSNVKDVTLRDNQLKVLNGQQAVVSRNCERLANK